MKKEREACISADEMDSVTKIPLKIHDKPGVRKKVKRKMNQRTRRRVKFLLKRHGRDYNQD